MFNLTIASAHFIKLTGLTLLYLIKLSAVYPIIRARPVNAISPAPIATAPIPVTTIEPITVASAAKPVIANPATATPLSADSHGTLLIAIIAGAIEY